MLLVLSQGSIARAQWIKTFFIDDQLYYETDAGCGTINELGDRVSSLVPELYASGWAGDRYTEDQAWPQDFFESCSASYGAGGVDNLYADAKTLAVFSGHGSWNAFHWHVPHNGECTVLWQDNMRLGQMSGGQAAYLMTLSSWGASSPDLIKNTQLLRQFFGYANSPWIGDDQARDFFLSSSAQSNTDSWLNNMHADNNNPRAITLSSSNLIDCWNKMSTYKLRGQVGLLPRRVGATTCGRATDTTYTCYVTWE